VTQRPRPLSLELASELKRRLQRRFGPRLIDVRLFGSQARGAAHDESDVDVLVLIEGLTRPEKIAVFEVAAEVGIEGGMTLSALAMTPTEMDRLRSLEARLALDIDREGIPA
jgi:uncharacterized protein